MMSFMSMGSTRSFEDRRTVLRFRVLLIVTPNSNHNERRETCSCINTGAFEQTEQLSYTTVETADSVAQSEPN